MKNRTLLLMQVGCIIIFILATVVIGVISDHILRIDFTRNVERVVQSLDVNELEPELFQDGAGQLSSFHLMDLKMRDLEEAIRNNWFFRKGDTSLYSMRIQEGNIVFGPESIPEQDPRASLPGTLYKDPPDALQNVFSSGISLVEGPFTDEYGTFVSSFVALPRREANGFFVVIGADVKVKAWMFAIVQKMALPTTVVFVLLVVCIVGLGIKRQTYSAPKPILRRLLPSLSILLVLILSGSIMALFWQYKYNSAMRIGTMNKEIYSELENDLSIHASGMTDVLQPLAMNENLRDALKKDQVERIINDWTPLYKKLKEQSGVTHFYFMNSERVCLTRLHNLEKSGDVVNRYSILNAEKTGNIATGIETGLSGVFTLRVVQPIYESGKLIGYVEIGKEIEEIFKGIEIRFGCQLAVFINKSQVNRTQWENGMRHLDREADWDRYKKSVLVYSSQKQFPEAFDQIGIFDDNKDSHSGITETFNIDNKYYSVSSNTLHDISAKDVGILLIMSDKSEDQLAFIRILKLGITVGICLLALILGFVFSILRKADTGIVMQQNALIASKEEAEVANRVKSEFLANMSHEIRTPMNAIIGFSNLAMKSEMTPKLHNYIHKIDSSAKSLLGIINDILDFSKLEAGKLEMEAIAFSLEDTIGDALDIVSLKAAEKDIEVLTNISNEIPLTLIGDPLRLGQILINLTTNAVKFTERGNILIKAELVERNDASCRIKISVADTGIGMTEEQKNKMFLAFSQADTSITRKYGGTGLGLTISKRLAEMMNGQISVDSKLGVGSTFSVTCEFLWIDNKIKHKIVEHEKFEALKVLVVDDNEFARSILKDQLAMLGIRANSVDSGSAAIMEIKKESTIKPYDLVFMDWRMPGIDGIETADIILKDKEIMKTPMTIMVTAFGREEIAEKARKIGINAFLGKPIKQSLLLESIIDVLGMKTIDNTRPIIYKKGLKEKTSGLNGKKILLVEDNVLNQEVATELLKSAGIIVQVANNGEEAVNFVANSEFDIILMDIQMPIMGGYEATRVIREVEKNRELPIIAMTAHAMQGAKEDCLKAGMNDYIGKPIDPDNLFTVIKQWVKPSQLCEQEKIETVDTSETIETADTAETIETADTHLCESYTYVTSHEHKYTTSSEGNFGINFEAGLNRLLGDEKRYARLLKDLSKSYSSLPQDMKKALEKNDTKFVMRMAHTIKGVAGNLSAYNIQRIAAELETAAADFETTAAEIETAATSQNYLGKNINLLNDLEEAFHSLKEFVEKLDEQKEKLDEQKEAFVENKEPFNESKKDKTQSIQKPFNLSEVEPILNKLAELIWEDNFDAENKLEELRKFMGDYVFSDEMNALTESISEFDFKTAKGHIQKIADDMNIKIEYKL